MIENTLWTEKYRPTTLDGYVFVDDQQRDTVEQWIKDKTIPHLLISGTQGIGKTTLAKILLSELGVHPYDIKEVNASRTNSVDDIRTTIINFVQMMPFGEFKVVLLDEADFLSLSAQAALRGVFEEYHNTARFILTCNYPNRLMAAISSRCQGFHMDKLDVVEFTARVASILLTEDIIFDLDTLDTFVSASYPDLRKCINNIQMNSVDGKLMPPVASGTGTSDYQLEMVALFKQRKIAEARKVICANARPEDMEDIYRWLYTNVALFGDTEEQRDNAILIIKNALVDHTIVSDSEINMAACLIKLTRNVA